MMLKRQITILVSASCEFFFHLLLNSSPSHDNVCKKPNCCFKRGSNYVDDELNIIIRC